MSANDGVSGAYKELHLVDALGEVEESNTLVGYLYEDFTLSQDATEITIESSSSEISATFDTHKSISAEASHFWAQPMDVLETYELEDPDSGEFIFDAEFDAARVLLYDRSPDQVTGPTDAIDGVELPNFRPRWDELAWPASEVANISITAHVNGRPSRIDPSEVFAE